jgi:hypothetical protein
MFISHLPPAEVCSKLIKLATERNSLIWEILMEPSTADGLIFVKLTEAIPGAADIDREMAPASSTEPSSLPPAVEIVLIREAMRGRRPLPTDRTAEPSEAREPEMPAAQEENSKMEKHSPKKRKREISLAANNLFINKKYIKINKVSILTETKRNFIPYIVS